jgi:CubicO group peptidase (beta-lactamase class C family)
MIKTPFGFGLLITAVATLLTAPPASWGQAARASSPANALDADETAAVDEAVREELVRQEIVGAAVGLLHEGRIVYLKGYGLADRRRETPVDLATVFNWASNSKPLLAVAAMQLVEQGDLDLDADIRHYVPEFPAHETPITMRHLLCHQSGLPHYDAGRVVPSPRRDPQSRPELDAIHALDRFSASPLIFRPGTRTSYSSYAYVLASAVVERAGKRRFASQIRERIGDPLILSSLQVDVATNGQPHWAVGYDENDDNEIVRAAETAHAWKHGAGAYKSNIVDFARWAQALLNRRLLKPATYREMWSAQPLTDGKPTTWGLGFVIENQNGLKVSHNGKQEEATSRMVLYPDSKHGIVVLTNCGFADPGAITTAIYRALDE